MLTILVEGSELLYRCAAASQHVRYKAVNLKTGEERSLKQGVDLKKVQHWLQGIYNHTGTEYDLVKYYEAEPVENCLRLIKNKLMWLRSLGTIRVFLSNPECLNFRFAVAKTAGPNGLGYKAGRADKPLHYQAARDYILRQPEAELANFFEEDDMLSMNQTDNTVIASIDKDLNMVAGKHLDWVTGRRYIVPEGLGELFYSKGKTRGYGLLWFYFQMLKGDNCDNIPGLSGIGDKRAYDLLKDCTTEGEVFNIVKTTYYNKLGGTKETKARIYEIADLLWMCRRCPKTHLVIRGSSYLMSRGFVL